MAQTAYHQQQNPFGHVAIEPRHGIAALFHSVGEWHRRWTTERALDALPNDMRKDIGWPTADEGVTGHQHTAGRA